MTPIRSWTSHWLGAEPQDRSGHLCARWLLLRALGLIFFSAFYSWYFQVEGLIGPQGILPAQDYLHWLATHAGLQRFWLAPSVLWFGSGATALRGVCWGGLIASVLLTLNVWPRGTIAVCTVLFLSLISAARDFSSYQSDGMLLEAGFISLFFAPSGGRPGLGEFDPPSIASRFLLQWEWFRIYFESGMAKLLSGDPHWRHLTAMDDYYQNGPLPTWIGWYAQQLPHAFHAATALLTLVVELAVVWMLFLPRRFRILCFWILLPFQLAIILTANYTFLNYLVLVLSVLLLDDGYLKQPLRFLRHGWVSGPKVSRLRLYISGLCLGWVFYVTTALMILMPFPWLPLPVWPAELLEPCRIANQYGLFAVMTPARFEIEFQGSQDGKTWIPYPFHYKPQDLREPPRIYAPYQPRFDWNLWFASLGTWREYSWVAHTEELLLQKDASVLSLFKANPFPKEPPRQVRAVLWQYWFTDLSTKRREGLWWRREERGLYAPALERRPDGKIAVTAMPNGEERH